MNTMIGEDGVVYIMAGYIIRGYLRFLEVDQCPVSQLQVAVYASIPS